MQKAIKYTIFTTKWGHFGLAAGDNGLFRTCLPLAEPERVKSQLLQNLPNPRYDKIIFKTVQDQIIAYFEGAVINFTDIPVVLDGFSSFFGSVLTACRDVGFGWMITYAGLARKIGRPAAARAVGNALAKNPLPLIIPCHRIICGDGKIGGFSAIGGKDLKAKMLKHEQTSRIDCKSS
ncbi:MAG: methylated-DNA--[protein]-cysteine S-methyltransferase [Planctomycetota bacterium]|jgi:methylated-DNA-[protein]-cysteine S-methyltransferase